MQIKDMFQKPINREIEGVIKAGQDNEIVAKQELEEYVVTEELEEHIYDFFSAYTRSIDKETDKVGVWISGFFGSGKSHFLKILSYLVENKKIAGKNAIDYFIEDEKINNHETVELMGKSSQQPTDVILFNIDAQSETPGTKDSDTILNVFLKVFNEHLGYSTDPHIAKFERRLERENQYIKFQNKFKVLTGDTWLESRNEFDFITDDIVDVLVDLNIMSEEAAWNWIESTNNEFKTSVEDFAILVKSYLDSQGSNHRICFFVDEVGQFIGSSQDLMLNLQTLTEELGNHCKGRAWIVVTSQQDIDSISKVIKVVGDDFSKIQGRFDTRLNLTSSNVDEVIKIRILEKTDEAEDLLKNTYKNNETQIKNILTFTEGPEKKIYSGQENFSEVYPFIPYQFDILGKVLTAIRKSGAAGKHLSEGERSLLALFKESAEKMMYEEDGVLAPFYIFYDSLENWLDHSHASVIKKAKNNGNINPEKEKNNFTIDVLKALFMVKYVDEIEANLENVTTLMVNNIDTDRLDLQDRVARSLKILSREMLIQKNGENYIFLTDEEQEVNRMIANKTVDYQEIINEVSKDIFEDIYPNHQIAMDSQNRYLYKFNMEIDDISYNKDQNYDFGIKIYTPLSSNNGEEATLKMQSGKDNNVYIDLPVNNKFIEEYEEALKIEKYLRTDLNESVLNHDDIRKSKSRERTDHRDRAKLYLIEALKNANFYVNSQKLEVNSNNFRQNLDDSLKILVKNIYHKLNYIDTHYKEEDVIKLLEGSDTQLNLLTNIPNYNAIDEVRLFIEKQTYGHSQVLMGEIINEFTRPPFGFVVEDIHWIIAYLFKNGEIELRYNSEILSLLNDSAENIAKYITSSRNYDKVRIDKKNQIPDRKKRIVKNISKELFNSTIGSNESAVIAKEFIDSAKNLYTDLDRIKSQYSYEEYPGRDVISKGMELLKTVTNKDNESSIIEYVVKKENDFLDFSEDLPELDYFFNGEADQKGIWDKAVFILKIYDDSKRFIDDEKIHKLAKEIKEILKKQKPYSFIKDLPALIKGLQLEYGRLLEEIAKPIRNTVVEEKDEVYRVLEERHDREELDDKQVDQFKEQVEKEYKNLLEDIDSANNIARLKGYSIESDELKIKLLNEVEEIDNIEVGTDGYGGEGKGTGTAGGNEGGSAGPIGPTRKYKSIKSVNPRTSLDLRTEEDVDEFISDLADRLKDTLEEGTIITITF